MNFFSRIKKRKSFSWSWGWTYDIHVYPGDFLEQKGLAVQEDIAVVLQDAAKIEKSTVLALSMMDIVEKRGMEIDLNRLLEMLGIPVVRYLQEKDTMCLAIMQTRALVGVYPCKNAATLKEMN